MFVLYITVAVCCPCGVINDDDKLTPNKFKGNKGVAWAEFGRPGSYC